MTPEYKALVDKVGNVSLVTASEATYDIDSYRHITKLPAWLVRGLNKFPASQVYRDLLAVSAQLTPDEVELINSRSPRTQSGTMQDLYVLSKVRQELHRPPPPPEFRLTMVAEKRETELATTRVSATGHKAVIDWGQFRAYANDEGYTAEQLNKIRVLRLLCKDGVISNLEDAAWRDDSETSKCKSASYDGVQVDGASVTDELVQYAVSMMRRQQ